MLSSCDDSSRGSKPYIPIVEAPSSKALTPNNVATVTHEYDFPILWRVDGKADDVLVFVKDGKVLSKIFTQIPKIKYLFLIIIQILLQVKKTN